jgi:hypothetical protein
MYNVQKHGKYLHKLQNIWQKEKYDMLAFSDQILFSISYDSTLIAQDAFRQCIVTFYVEIVYSMLSQAYNASD